jgi:hypothetical protein
VLLTRTASVPSCHGQVVLQEPAFLRSLPAINNYVSHTDIYNVISTYYLQFKLFNFFYFKFIFFYFCFNCFYFCFIFFYFWLDFFYF